MKMISFLKIPTAIITIFPYPPGERRTDLSNMDYVVKADCEVLVIPVINGKMYSQMADRDELDREDLTAVHKSREARQDARDKKRRESFWLTKA